MKVELIGHQVRQMDVVEELIVSAASIGGLIVMSGFEDAQKLLQSNVRGIRRLVVG